MSINSQVIQKRIHEIFEDIAAASNRAEAADKLNYYNESLPPDTARVMRDIIKGALDPFVIWVLPTTTLKYNPSPDYAAPSNLVKMWPNILKFVDGSNVFIVDQRQRINHFIQFLESIHPADAEIISNMVQKRIDYKHVTMSTVRQAFGDGFFEEDRRVKTSAAA